MKDSNPNHSEIIIVRSLTGSDLGLFKAHRSGIQSKQRAININAQIAPRLLSADIYKNKSRTQFQCDIIFGDFRESSSRPIGKVGKNWRLGGNKIDDKSFGTLDSKDFALLRTIEMNDGTYPITILFISKISQKKVHTKIGRLVEHTIKSSMAIYLEGSAGFSELADMFLDKAPKRRRSKNK